MSTVFRKKNWAITTKKQEGTSKTAGEAFQAPREARCGLCRGELYPGDPYFELDGRAVCEDCLGRYARRYFAPQLRRVGGRQQIFDRKEET